MAPAVRKFLFLFWNFKYCLWLMTLRSPNQVLEDLISSPQVWLYKLSLIKRIIIGLNAIKRRKVYFTCYRSAYFPIDCTISSKCQVWCTLDCTYWHSLPSKIDNDRIIPALNCASWLWDMNRNRLSPWTSIVYSESFKWTYLQHDKLCIESEHFIIGFWSIQFTSTS